jgi:glycosyltransferase involved in cell wall biosynthesis
MSLTIGLFSSSFLPQIGGVEVGLHNIANQLISKGYKPIIITSFSHTLNLKKMKIKLPYKVIAYPPKIFSLFLKYPLLGQKILELFYNYIQKKYKFDFWHATFIYPIGISIINFCNVKNINYLIRGVGEDIQIKKNINYGMRLNAKINNQIIKWLPKAKNLVAVTDSIKKTYLSLGIKKDNIISIPNGVDIKRIKNFKSSFNLKKKFDIKASDFIFLSVGRYHIKKNFEILIKASKKLSKKNKNFKLLIYGSGVNKLSSIIKVDNLEYFVKLIEPNKKINNTSENFKLPSSEVFSLYKQSNVFLMPSLIESFGIVTVEAMSFGLPVIINNSSGNRDIVRNGKDGYLFNNCENELSKIMEEFLDNKILIKKQSRKSLDRSKSFDWSKIVDQYTEIYSFKKNYPSF